MPKKSASKKNWMKILAVLALVIIAITAVAVFQKEKSAPQPILTEKEAPKEGAQKEEAPEPEQTPELAEATGAQYGDLLKINYILSMEDGTVIETNNETLAKEHNVKAYMKGPFTFIIGQSDKIYGQQTKAKPFDDAIVGLEVGDIKTVEIKPSEEILVYIINMSEKKQRRTNIPRVHLFSKAKFAEKFNETPSVGKTVSNPDYYPWDYEIVNVTAKNVYGKVLLNNGDEVVLPGTEWKSLALDVAEKAIIFEQNPKIGQIINTSYGQAEITNLSFGLIWLTHMPELGKEFEFQEVHELGEGGRIYDFRVEEVYADKFVIKRINYPQQENLKLYVEILDIQKGIKKLEELN